jgi:uncharacterized protein (DUF983 family)
MATNTSREISMAQGILQGRCPVCREGAVFQNPMMSLNFLQHHEHCSVCATRFEVEPGFFWGAMYFNYAFNIGMLAAMGLFMYFVLHVENPLVYIFGMLSPVILSIPLTGRLSRMLWIYWFGPFRYQPDRSSAGQP